jgi:CRP-like cAMP-binding protein
MTSQGDIADHLFLLARGRGRFFYLTEEGKKLILLWLAPGEIFGARTVLLIPSAYLVSTEAVKESWVMVWNHRKIRDLATRYPRLLDKVILEASDLIASQLASYVVLTSYNVQQRLVHVLTTLAPRIGREVSAGIEIDVTNEELASAANVTLFTASRLLSSCNGKGSPEEAWQSYAALPGATVVASSSIATVTAVATSLFAELVDRSISAYAWCRQVGMRPNQRWTVTFANGYPDSRV